MWKSKSQLSSRHSELETKKKLNNLNNSVNVDFAYVFIGNDVFDLKLKIQRIIF